MSGFCFLGFSYENGALSYDFDPFSYENGTFLDENGKYLANLLGLFISNS
jgi:hypothetical protein